MASNSTFSSESPPFACATPSKKAWDVFINHFGEDVKNTFAATVYDRLDHTGLRVFLDREALEAGDVITAEIEEAMRSASLHIAIFSPNYAKSPWCLQELSFMIQTSTKIIPVFYHVEPCDLRWVAQAKGVYASAFAQHDKKGYYPKEKLQEWKEALRKFSFLSGLVVKNNFDEGEVLKKIAEIVQKATRNLPFDVAKHPVGLDSMVRELERYIDASAQGENSVKILGIVGVEGVDKTTFAKEVYNRKYSSSYHASFVFNLRDAASKRVIHKRQKKLLMDIDVKNQGLIIDNMEEGKKYLASRLRSSSVLIVLDDVSHEDQLDALLPKSARDHLGCNSLIIVTSRKLRVLTKWGISSNAIYRMKGLDDCDAEQLLCQHAFLQPHPKEGFEELVQEYLIECRGLPLSLVKRGEEVYNRTNACDTDWQTKLPLQYKNILSEKGFSSEEEI